MKCNYLKLLFCAFLMSAANGVGYASSVNDDGTTSMVVKFAAKNGAARSATSTMPGKLLLNGTGAKATVFVEATGLEQDVQVAVTSGFSVTPAVIKAGTESVEVTVTNTSTRNQAEGKLILRSGDIRTYVSLWLSGKVLGMFFCFIIFCIFAL